MSGVFGYRFGEFEVRLADEALLRNGVPLPIQKLPFQMLTILLEEPGRVVPREDIQKRLWGDQNYLQFENGLHVAAAKLREALGKQASSPKYVKTITRKGRVPHPWLALGHGWAGRALDWNHAEFPEEVPLERG